MTYHVSPEFVGVWDDICFNGETVIVPEPETVVQRVLVNLTCLYNQTYKIVNSINMDNTTREFCAEHLKDINKKIKFLRDNLS
jgi:hypothetical protein